MKKLSAKQMQEQIKPAIQKTDRVIHFIILKSNRTQRTLCGAPTKGLIRNYFGSNMCPECVHIAGEMSDARFDYGTKKWVNDVPEGEARCPRCQKILSTLHYCNGFGTIEQRWRCPYCNKTVYSVVRRYYNSDDLKLMAGYRGI